MLGEGPDLVFGRAELRDNDEYICRPTNDVGDGTPTTWKFVVNGESGALSLVSGGIFFVLGASHWTLGRPFAISGRAMHRIRMAKVESACCAKKVSDRAAIVQSRREFKRKTSVTTLTHNFQKNP